MRKIGLISEVLLKSSDVYSPTQPLCSDRLIDAIRNPFLIWRINDLVQIPMPAGRRADYAILLRRERTERQIESDPALPARVARLSRNLWRLLDDGQGHYPSESISQPHPTRPTSNVAHYNFAQSGPISNKGTGYRA